MLFISLNNNPYQKAETQASSILSLHHEYKDSTIYCGGKLKSLVVKDSMINKPGGIGTEYNYPLYKYETEIIYYENSNIASIEKKKFIWNVMQIIL